MLVVETIAKIRRMHLAQGRSIRSIARDLGVSKNTVRKVVRSGATEHRYSGRRVSRARSSEASSWSLRGFWRRMRGGAGATA